MNVLKLTLAAAALVLGSGAASAATSRDQVSTDRSSVDQVGVARLVDGRTASRPTIFGHDAAASRYIPSGRTVQVWGHALDR